MTRLFAASIAPYVKLFGEGKEIQYRSTPESEWTDVVETLNFELIKTSAEFRLKPREFSLHILKDGSLEIYNRSQTGKGLLAKHQACDCAEKIIVREVV